MKDGQEAENASTTSSKSKVCEVCGDKALGFNFNALTCESCKAFFRRNALKNKVSRDYPPSSNSWHHFPVQDFKCPFSNECEVTVVTRRFCQRCRLKKCFDVGMKKEWILSDAEKQQKRQKIEENRAKKRTDQVPKPSTSSSSPSSPTEQQVSALVKLDVPPILTSQQVVVPIPDLPRLETISPLASECSGSSERPQARVLPSARPPSADGKPRQKVMRIESSQQQQPQVIMNPPQLPQQPHQPQQPEPEPSTSSSFSLIKQELGSASPTSYSHNHDNNVLSTMVSPADEAAVAGLQALAGVADQHFCSMGAAPSYTGLQNAVPMIIPDFSNT